MASQYKLWSLGIVVEDKPRGTEYVLATPIEILYDQSAGLVIDQKADKKGLLPRVGGRSFQSEHEAVNYVRAKYLPESSGNKMTPPDLRVNDEIDLYTYGVGTEEIYWVERGRTPGLRDFEDDISAWSNKAQGSPDEEASEENSVTFRVNTYDGFIHLHTPTNNGEPAGFDIKIDMKAGVLSIVDTNNQHITMDSPNGKLSIEMNDEIFMKSKNINLECETYKLEADDASNIVTNQITNETIDITNSATGKIQNTTPMVHNSEKTTTDGDELIKGNTTTLGVTQTSGIGMGGEPIEGEATLNGPLTVRDKTTLKDDLQVNKNTTMDGDLELKGTATGEYPSAAH